MKKHVIALFAGLILFQFAAQAQSFKNEVLPFDSAQAFLYYKALFAEKGVTQLTEGMHKIVVTVRHMEDSLVTREYYQGLARVENTKFLLPLKLYDANGKQIKPTEKVDQDSYKKYKIPVENKIIHGMSPTIITESSWLVDIFIVDLLNK